MTPSRVLAKLRAGDFVKVAGIGRVAEPWLTEVVGRIGYDVIWFDMEHRSYSVDKIDPLSLACRATGRISSVDMSFCASTPVSYRALWAQ